MVESHTKRRDNEYILGEHLLGKILKMMLKMVLIVRVWYSLIENHQQNYGNNNFCKQILIINVQI